MIPILAKEINEMSKQENSDIQTMGLAMQEAVLTFGATLLIYLDEQRSNAMNYADESFSAKNEVGLAYWNGRTDLSNQLIDLLKPLTEGD